MSFESGLGSNSAPYEYSVEVKNKKQKRKKISFVAAYVAYVIIVFGVGAATRIIVPFLAFVPLSTWVIVWLTWKYTQLSYEYSFFKGEITVTCVFGTNKKNVLANIKIKKLTEVRYFNSDEGEKISDISADRVVFAARSEQAERLAVLRWTEDDGGEAVLFIELDETAYKIIHYYNSSVA